MPSTAELFDAALRAQQSGRVQDAVQLYRRILDFDAENLGALGNLGVLLGQMREYAQAEPLLRRVMSRAPDDAKAYISLGTVLHGQRKFDEAIRYCEAGLRLAPNEKTLLNILASSLSEAGRYDEAIALLTKIVTRHPRFALGHYGLGTTYVKLGKCDEAVKHFKRATAINPGDVLSLVSAGECLLIHGRAEEALAQLDAALRVQAYNVRALALKTLALAELGRQDEERWLADPHRLVQLHQPAEYGGDGDVTARNRALSAFASSEPSLREDPAEYATANAWHSTTNLADSDHPAIAALKRFIGNAFERRVRTLPQEDPAHPFVRGVPARYHIDMWAVKMASGGKMLPHIHLDGWLSGVYYVDVPSIVNDPDGGEAGWLKLGAPRSDIKLTREPITRTVKPAPGLLVTFPSYIWHDTVPLPQENNEQRLCLAFDLHPRPAA
jgi:tetratricopeptide (TPR) repeat protein